MATASLPLPLAALDAWRRGYAAVQPAISRVTASLPLPALDLVVVVVASLALWCLTRAIRHRRLAPLVWRVVITAASLWLLFLVSWGWHYQVPTLEARLVDTRPTAQDIERFAEATVAQLNAHHAAAHATPWPTRTVLAHELAPHLARVLPRLGVAWTPHLPAARRTLLEPWFTWAGVDGMTNPLGLEVLVEGHVLPFELPALVAHEYAHLAGFADEADASVVAWLACQDGGPALRYSGALAVLPHLVAGMPSETRARVLGALDEGPRGDLAAISARLSARRAWAEALAWRTYDSFLKANRVEEGVARYDAVTRVLAAMADPATGRLKATPLDWRRVPRR